ncbi:MAG: MFS transporter [Rickettsiaceae bacterium]|nr:MFS transporter [Rickettsiaceae bacterium]MDP5082976.1 MFS transporter [Rickettsiaceae bacterium]
MQDNKFRTKGFVVWGLCAIFFLYEFFLRTVTGTYQDAIMQDLQLTSFQFSLLSTTLFFIVYGAMQLPVGIIVDNIGLKKSIIIATLSCSIASIGFAYSYSYETAIFYRGIMGFGAAFGFICLLMAVYDWMPHRYSAIFIGLSQLIGTLGPMTATGPLHTLSTTMGVTWRQLFLYLGIFGVVLLVLAFLFIENNQQKAGKYIILYKPESLSVAIKRLFTRSQPWFIAILSTSLYFTIEYLSENEGRAFLLQKGISLGTSSYMLTTSWIGYAIGCPLLGYFSDLLQRRKPIMAFAAVLGCLSITSILYLPTNYLVVSFFFLGISAGGQSVGFATIAEHFKKQFVAIGFGLNNAMIVLIAAINAPLIGFLLDNSKQGNKITLADYQSVFNVLIILSVISVVVAVFYIKETFCKSSADFTYLKKR